MNYTSIGIKLTSLSPLLLCEGPPSQNLLESLEFIPGNTLRGLLAQKYLSQPGNTPENKIFSDLFLTDNIRFGFARINGAQVIPLSARSCKYNGGFEQDGGDGVVDILLESKEICCPKCERALDYFTGYWNPEENKKQKVKKRLHTRTAIDSLRGSASSEQLYSQHLIEEGQIFFGTIEIQDRFISEIDKLIKSPFTAGIGRGRSRGQGWVQVEKTTTVFSTNWGLIKDRFDQVRNQSQVPSLIITFLSDAIFHDRYLRDCTGPDLSMLKGIGIEPSDWDSKPYSAFSANRMVFGFDGLPISLPRIPRLAVTAGSIFCFKAKGNNPTIPEGDGLIWIGDKNGEGYGQAILWHPFHTLSEGKSL